MLGTAEDPDTVEDSVLQVMHPAATQSLVTVVRLPWTATTRKDGGCCWRSRVLPVLQILWEPGLWQQLKILEAKSTVM